MTAGTSAAPASELPLPSAAIILNASSGKHRIEETRDRLHSIFEAHGRSAEITLCGPGKDLSLLTRAALSAGHRVVVAGGGDGTISAVAADLVGSRAALGVIPLGTLNHFAKDLGIPLDLDGAARNLIEGRIAKVDVGEVNGRIFLNNSSLGLYPTVVHRRDAHRERLGWGKWPALIWASLVVLRRYPFLDVRLETEGQQLKRRTPFVFIGNNEYQIEGFNLGARSCLNAGHLSLYITRDVGRLGLLRLGVRALLRRLREDRDFDALCLDEVVIETRRKKRRVSTDGEITLMTAPFRYRIRRAALDVIVPGAAR